MIETNKKIISILLIIGAVFACTAPFVHKITNSTKNIALEKIRKEYKEGKFNREVFIQKKRSVTYFGYSTLENFWYAIGKPITMLYFALLLMYASCFIKDTQFQKTFRGISLLGVFISFYFLIWAFWYRADFPKNMYFFAIGVVSILSTFFSYKLIASQINIIEIIHLLTNHIVFKGKKHVPDEKKGEYVKDYLKTFDKMMK